MTHFFEMPVIRTVDRIEQPSISALMTCPRLYFGGKMAYTEAFSGAKCQKPLPSGAVRLGSSAADPGRLRARCPPGGGADSRGSGRDLS
jgi:hypothetical protein